MKSFRMGDVPVKITRITSKNEREMNEEKKMKLGKHCDHTK